MGNSLVSVSERPPLSVTVMVSVTEVAVVTEGAATVGVSVLALVIMTVLAGLCVQALQGCHSYLAASVAVAPARVTVSPLVTDWPDPASCPGSGVSGVTSIQY